MATSSLAQRALTPALRRGLALPASPNAARLLSTPALPRPSSALSGPSSHTSQKRAFRASSSVGAPPNTLLGLAAPSAGIPSYFQKPSLPMNLVVHFVPQQTAWIVERMGKFNRILEPGLALLVPFLDRIAYVKSLKEVAIEIPSQSAITADNVTLELDGVLYTRVFDAYKARCVLPLPTSFPPLSLTPPQTRPPSTPANHRRTPTATASKTPSTPSPSWRRRPCAARSAS